MTDLYDADILLWSERQANALRRRAVNEIDWENIAEEIADLGKVGPPHGCLAPRPGAPA